MKKEVMGLRQRIINLRKFIADCKILKFNLPLIACYQGQLTELESEQARDKAKRQAFYNSIKIQNYKNVVQKCTALEV